MLPWLLQHMMDIQNTLYLNSFYVHGHDLKDGKNEIDIIATYTRHIFESLLHCVHTQ